MNVSEELIRSIVEKVIAETASAGKCGFQKQVDPSGVIGVKTSTVELEPSRAGTTSSSRMWPPWRRPPAWAAASWSSLTAPTSSGP